MKPPGPPTKQERERAHDAVFFSPDRDACVDRVALEFARLRVERDDADLERLAIATEIVQRTRADSTPESESLSFFCPGVPVPKGSMRGFTRKGGGVGMEEGNADRVRPWMHTLAWEARAAGCSSAEGPVAVGLTFWFPRPKGHFTPKGVLKASAPRFHITKPDIDKLTRACLDALAHVALADDARVVALDPAPWKYYADAEHPPGARVVVRRLA